MKGKKGNWQIFFVWAKEEQFMFITALKEDLKVKLI